MGEVDMLILSAVALQAMAEILIEQGVESITPAELIKHANAQILFANEMER